ncbi:dinitrogenase iron-molybdenum cofactor biosynthesis protein [Candidatus Sulfurimonas marisnigri]|uniref:Dinitrogenase iron-molybdenum cofactor biosynthesis protein n=1 Tax=Candidatus Sulfurimonas marisnigri TaxID=2740405 RepID=A0A7S7LZN1_9BACT|nr:NifB/NifX family molybdenum-iron cluster-binding protein [Candidatus Sulfurimonas marisnigri]QOY53823.1 dinitrogenase iron-molybdenum cofactor biosynthesis protein [Candidatus Sulfurimonas marisnigri]
MNSTIKVTSNSDSLGSIKVAFATNDNEHIDAHFGSTKQFNIYDINSDGFDISTIIKITTKDTDATVALLNGCDIVYFLNIGPTAAAKVIRKGIFPIKYKEIISIDEELNKLVNMLNENPPPFIKKIIEKKSK